MKKFKTLFKTCLAIVMVCFIGFNVNAQLRIVENFNYSAGSIIGQINNTGAVVNLTWTEAVNTVPADGAPFARFTVTDPLTFPNYIASGIGNAGLFDVFVGTTNQDYRIQLGDLAGNDRILPAQSEDAYMAFMLRIDTSASSGGMNIVGLSQSPTAPNTRLWVQRIGSGASVQYRLGVSRGNAGSNGDVAWAPQSADLNPRQTYLIVFKAAVVSSGSTTDGTIQQTQLFINPVPGQPEPAPIVSSTNTNAAINAVSGLFMRANGSNGYVTAAIGGIRVGTTWEDVVAAGGTTPPVVQPVVLSPNSHGATTTGNTTFGIAFRSFTGNTWGDFTGDSLYFFGANWETPLGVNLNTLDATRGEIFTCLQAPPITGNANRKLRVGNGSQRFMFKLASTSLSEISMILNTGSESAAPGTITPVDRWATAITTSPDGVTWTPADFTSDTAAIRALNDGCDWPLVIRDMNIPAGQFVRIELNGAGNFLEAVVTPIPVITGDPTLNLDSVTVAEGAVPGATFRGTGPWTHLVRNDQPLAPLEFEIFAQTPAGVDIVVTSDIQGILTAPYLAILSPTDDFDTIRITVTGTEAPIVGEDREYILVFEKDKTLPTATVAPANSTQIAKEGNIVLTWNRNITQTGNITLNGETVPGTAITVNENILTVAYVAADWDGTESLELVVPAGAFRSQYFNQNELITLTYTANNPTITKAEPINLIAEGFLGVEDAVLEITFSQVITAIDATEITAEYVGGAAITNFIPTFAGTVLTLTFPVLLGGEEVEVTLATDAVTGASGWGNKLWSDAFEVFDPNATPDIVAVTLRNPSTGGDIDLEGAVTWATFTADIEFARADVVRDPAVNITLNGINIPNTQITGKSIQLTGLPWDSAWTLVIPEGAWVVDGFSNLKSDPTTVNFRTRVEDRRVVLALSADMVSVAAGGVQYFRSITDAGTFGAATGNNIGGRNNTLTGGNLGNNAFNLDTVRATTQSILFNCMTAPVAGITPAGVPFKRRSNSGNAGYVFNIVTSGYSELGILLTTGGNDNAGVTMELNAASGLSVGSSPTGPWTVIPPYSATEPNGFKLTAGTAVGANRTDGACGVYLVISNLDIPRGRYLQVRVLSNPTGTTPQFVEAYIVPTEARPLDLDKVTVAAAGSLPEQTFTGAGPWTYWLENIPYAALPEITAHVIDGYETDVTITFTHKGNTITSASQVAMPAGVYLDTIVITAALTATPTTFERYLVIFEKDTVLPIATPNFASGTQIPAAGDIVLTFNKNVTPTLPLNEIVTINGSPVTPTLNSAGTVLTIPYTEANFTANAMEVNVVAGAFQDRVLVTTQAITLNYMLNVVPPTIESITYLGNPLDGAINLPRQMVIDLEISRTDIERDLTIPITLNGENLEESLIVGNTIELALEFLTEYELVIPEGAFRVISDHTLVSNAMSARFTTMKFVVVLASHQAMSNVHPAAQRQFRAFRHIIDEDIPWGDVSGDTIWFMFGTGADGVALPPGGGNLALGYTFIDPSATPASTNTGDVNRTNEDQLGLYNAMLAPRRGQTFDAEGRPLTMNANSKLRMSNRNHFRWVLHNASTSISEIALNMNRGTNTVHPDSVFPNYVIDVAIFNEDREYLFDMYAGDWTSVPFISDTARTRGIPDVGVDGPYIINITGLNIPRGAYVRITTKYGNMLAEVVLTPLPDYTIETVTFNDADGAEIDGFQTAETAFNAFVNFRRDDMVYDPSVAITLNGTPIPASAITGTSIAISGLSYATNYTLVIPEKAFVSTANSNWFSQEFTVNFRTKADVSIQIIEEGKIVTIYPNPVFDVLHVEAESMKQIEIIDMLGRTVFRKTTTETHESIDVSNFREGLYFIRVTAISGEVAITRFVKR